MALDPGKLTFEAFKNADDYMNRKDDLILSIAPKQPSIEVYDNVFDKLVSVLEQAGSVSYGGLDDADFSVSRYAGLSNEITVVASPSTAARLIEVGCAALNSIGRPFAITFDTGSYITIFSSGNILGCSDWEQLTTYGFPE